MNQDPYQSINCSWYDQLEVFAMHQTPIQLTVAGPTGDPEIHHIVISRLDAREGAEWLTTTTGITWRLDRLLAVNDQPLSGPCRLS